MAPNSCLFLTAAEAFCVAYLYDGSLCNSWPTGGSLRIVFPFYSSPLQSLSDRSPSSLEAKDVVWHVFLLKKLPCSGAYCDNPGLCAQVFFTVIARPRICSSCRRESAFSSFRCPRLRTVSRYMSNFLASAGPELSGIWSAGPEPRQSSRHDERRSRRRRNRRRVHSPPHGGHPRSTGRADAVCELGMYVGGLRRLRGRAPRAFFFRVETQLLTSCPEDPH